MPEGPILWVDDDVYSIQKLVGYVRDAGFEVLTAEGPDDALELLAKQKGEVSLALVDIMMPHGESFSAIETMGGYRTGLELARRIQTSWPEIPIVAFSVVADSETMEWFQNRAGGYLVKPARLSDVLKVVRHATGRVAAVDLDGPRCFIVHGHDDVALLQLKNYLQNTLRLPEPLVLREQPSLGRTIIEKFEDTSDDVDLVFVLFTPDDAVAGSKSADPVSRRARQNVIFELGFFYGKLQRRSGRVFLLHKGPVELPSDVAGIVYINISDGIEAAGEEIRRELGPWLRGAARGWGGGS